VRLRALALAVAIVWLAAPSTGTAARVYRVGMLWYGRSLETRQPVVDAFKQGLGEQGFVEGQNLVLEHRHSGATLDGLPGLAAELVRAKVDVIVASGPVAIRSARQVTTTTPIVMLNGDPAMFTNLARPGGNVTGLTALAAELAGKQMDLLREAVPGLTRVAMFRNPAQPVHAAKVQEVERVARALKVEVQIIEVRGPDEFEAAFAAATKARAGALLVPADGTYALHHAQLTELAAKHRLPAIYGSSDYARSGGLMEFVPNESEAFRSVARYVARILKGAHPGDLPIEQPTRFQLTLNLKTARTLGLTFPPSVLLRADAVIE
jgi:putative tryptophan/tyrosine transport system substrate-binding protein